MNRTPLVRAFFEGVGLRCPEGKFRRGAKLASVDQPGSLGLESLETVFCCFALGRIVFTRTKARRCSTPFGGLFTVPYRAIMLRRRGQACELNPEYFRDGLRYLREAEAKRDVPTLFDALTETVDAA